MTLAFSGGIFSLLAPKGRGVRRIGTSFLLAFSGVFAFVSGLLALTSGNTGNMLLPIGLPNLPVSLEIDALSGFFLLTLGALLTPVAIYSVGYLKAMEERENFTSLLFFLSLFIMGMQGVLLAGDAFAFMLFWELMSVSSYFLVATEHWIEDNRRASFLYLLMAHLSGLFILGGFSLLYAKGSGFTFEIMRAAELSPTWAATLFLLAGLGFGIKAGVVPFHTWLPAAHPVAPSNISALMSGLMIKIALYGFIRVVWDLMGTGDFQWWWGALTLAAGSASALSGILMALQQHELKRLLAYSSVDNIGVALIGLGLAMIYQVYDHPILASLGLIAALYHILNHAVFKGLLFMGAGAVLHGTGTGNMEKLGGLIHRMPVTSALFLVGSLAISSLPFLNGFVSEWLTFQTALRSSALQGTLLAALIPFSASMLALAGALTAVCFVKVYGVVFLGLPRSEEAASAHEVDGWMKTGMFIPALSCLFLGLAPTIMVSLIDAVSKSLLNVSLANRMADGIFWLTPAAGKSASYAPLLLCGVMLLIAGFLYLRFLGRKERRGPVWSCGFSDLNTRMQYTSASFSHPLRRIFQGIYRPTIKAEIEGECENLAVKRIHYSVYVRDLAERFINYPISLFALRIADWFSKQHERSIHSYLTVTFVVTIILLIWVTP